MSLEIKEIGAKLKELRKILGIKQDELVRYSTSGREDKPFTRNLISMIETGNASVTPALKSCIEYNINHIIEEKNINIKIDFDEFFMSPEEQGEYLVDEFLDNLSNKISEEEIFSYGNKLLKVLEEKKFYGQMGRVLIFLGIKAYRKDGNYDQGLEYLNKARVFNNELSQDDKLELAVKLKFCYLIKGQLEKALDVKYDKSIKNNEKVDKCKFNDIVTLSRLGRRDDISFESLKEIYSRYPKEHQFYKGLKLIEGNKYLVMKKYDTALTIYRKLKPLYKNDRDINMANFNIVLIGIDRGYPVERELEELLDYCFERKAFPLRYVHDRILNTIEERIRTHNIYPINDFLEKLVSKALEDNDEEYFNRYIMKLMDEVDIEDFQNLEMFQLYVLSGVERNLFQIKNYMKIILFFQEIGKYDFVKVLLEKANKE